MLISREAAHNKAPHNEAADKAAADKLDVAHDFGVAQRFTAAVTDLFSVRLQPLRSTSPLGQFISAASQAVSAGFYDVAPDFGWRSALSAAITRLFSLSASAAEVNLPSRRIYFRGLPGGQRGVL